MSNDQTPQFQNDAGAAQIRIGVRNFMCCGASEPFDHPHVFLQLGGEEEIVCPYCSTLYKFSDRLERHETEPQNCLFVRPAS